MFMYLYELRDYFAPLNVFRYVSFRIVMAMITALAMSFLYPKFISKLRERQVGQVVRDDGPQSHLKKRGTPTMGGSLILLSLVVSTLCWADLSNHYVWLFLGVTVFFGGVGFIDDYLKIREKGSRGLPGRWKLILQFAITAVAMFVLFQDDTLHYSSELYFPFVAADKFALSLPIIAYALFAMVVIVGTSNAVNLTDGLDGLAIAPVAVAAGTFLILCYVAGTVFQFPAKSLPPSTWPPTSVSPTSAASPSSASHVPPSSVPASDSSGSIPTPPKSSWAIWAAFPWAAHSACSPSSPKTNSSVSSSAASSSSKPFPSSRRPPPSNSPESASSKWPPSTITSSSKVGPNPKSSSVSGSSPSFCPSSPWPA